MTARKLSTILASAFVIAMGLWAYGTIPGSVGRADSPGKITCPMTGKEVCRDRCPLAQNAERSASLPSDGSLMTCTSSHATSRSKSATNQPEKNCCRIAPAA